MQYCSSVFGAVSDGQTDLDVLLFYEQRTPVKSWDWSKTDQMGRVG